MRVQALLALVAVTSLLAAPAVPPSGAQVSNNPCCAAGMAECAGMTSAGLCCQPVSGSRDDQGLLSQRTPEGPSRPQAWVGAAASPTLPVPSLHASLAGHAPRAREDLTPRSFSVLRI
jgi:hypothetical protein